MSVITEISASTTQTAPQPSRFLARQPILDVHRKIVGYELLFRSGWENCFRGDVHNATEIMLDNYLLMGIETLAHNELAFINCTREALLGRQMTLLPPASTVLEVLETVEPDDEVIEACRNYVRQGYRLALDDFVPRPEMQPLINLADFIKVDFLLSDAAKRRQIHRMVRGSRAQLLAEKVENESEFNIAIAEGYELFQGYFFCRPTIMAHHEIPPHRLHYLRLLTELSRTPANLRKVARIVESETSLCYRLLRLTNSAMMGLRTAVTSVPRALTVVGEDRFRTLVSVAAATALGGDQPPALISMALERARFCELLAPRITESMSEQYMIGLLSLVDAILQMPMEEILKSLPLRETAKAALMGEETPAALPLRLVKSFENGNWGPALAAAESHGIEEKTLAGIYVEAIRWAAEAIAST